MSYRLRRVPMWLGFLAIVSVVAEGKGPGKVAFPNLRIDLKTRTVEIDGEFCLGEHSLELLVCRGTLRDYEALISTSCKPSHLHAALLAVGLQPRVRDQKDPRTTVREGGRIDVAIRYERDGTQVTVSPAELMVEVVKGPDGKPTQRRVQAAPFVFTGSLLYPDHRDGTRVLYLGDVEAWLVGLLGDTPSVVDIEAGKEWVYGNLDIDTETAPPKGTKATVIFRPATPPQEGGAAR